MYIYIYKYIYIFIHIYYVYTSSNKQVYIFAVKCHKNTAAAFKNSKMKKFNNLQF